MDALSMPPETIAQYMARLTPRQLDVVAYMSNGNTQKKTSLLLSISQKTVRNHLRNARNIVGAENTMQLVSIFIAWKCSPLTQQSKQL
jgi:DNA-binding CsgD family transcriptional regulator